MKKKDFKIAQLFKKKLSEVTNLIDIRVFGSKSTGKGAQYSDMDIFLEVESLNKELNDKIDDIAWEVGFENSTVISPLVFTRNEVENTSLRASPILKAIMEDGIAV